MKLQGLKVKYWFVQLLKLPEIKRTNLIIRPNYMKKAVNDYFFVILSISHVNDFFIRFM